MLKIDMKLLINWQFLNKFTFCVFDLYKNHYKIIRFVIMKQLYKINFHFITKKKYFYINANKVYLNQNARIKEFD